MRLHSPAFEKSIRRRVRREVRASKTHRRSARAARRRRQSVLLLPLLRPLLSLALVSAVVHAFRATGHITAALAVITMWTAALAFFEARRLLVTLYASPDLAALMLLPITAGRVFLWQWQKFTRSSAWNLLDPMAGYLAVASLQPGTSWSWMLAAPAAVATWGASRALAIGGAAFLPRFPYPLASGLCVVIGLCLFAGREWIGAPAVQLLDQTATFLNLIIPTGWAAALYQALTPGGDLVLLCLLLPGAALLASIRLSRARLLASYQFGEVLQPQAHDLLPGTPPEAAQPLSEAPDTPHRVGLSEVEDLLRSRAFFKEPTWPTQGPLERLLWRWLTPRERALSEMTHPDGLRLTPAWTRILRLLAIAVLAAFLTGYIMPSARTLVLAIGLFFTGCYALACVLTSGRAFQPVPMGGLTIPFYVGFGVGYRELSRLLFKYSLIQGPCLLLYAVAAGWATALLVGWPVTNTLFIAIKAGALLMISRLLLVTASFSAGTNDTAMMRMRSFVLVVGLLGTVLVFVGLGAAFLFVPVPWVALTCGTLATLVAYTFHRFYGWCYSTGRFDLMSMTRS